MAMREDVHIEVADARRARLALSQQIDRVLPRLENICPIHFATAQEYTTCQGKCTLIDMTGYSNFRAAFVFTKYAYCFACGAPNDSETVHCFRPACHETAWYKGRDICPYRHLIFKVMFALWFRDDLRPMFCHDLDIRASSLAEFTQWAIQENQDLVSKTYFNGMSLLLWYCVRVGMVDPV